MSPRGESHACNARRGSLVLERLTINCSVIPRGWRGSQSGGQAIEPDRSIKTQGRFRGIESYGNGFAYQIVWKADGATVFLQGDDAIRLGQELDQTTERFTDADVASQYFA